MMADDSNRPHIGIYSRFAYAFIQGLFRLFAGGALIYELHQLVLQYYSYEWTQLQFSGADPACFEINWIARGDSIGGHTVCHSLLLSFPWLALYEDHWGPILVFYLTIAFIIGAIAFIWRWTHSKRRPVTPFGATGPTPESDDKNIG
jgi:hypothetical protein